MLQKTKRETHGFHEGDEEQPCTAKLRKATFKKLILMWDIFSSSRMRYSFELFFIGY